MVLPASLPAATGNAAGLIDELKRRRYVVPASEIVRRSGRVPSGIEALDRICGGGLPAGCLVELVVPSCGGGTVLYNLLAAATSRGELCALVDPADGFDPGSACTAGVDLESLLWVRARSRKEALRATELILDVGGFGMVALDLGRRGEHRPARSDPPAAWMRLRRLASVTGTVVPVLSGTAAAGTFASLSVRVRCDRARFRGRRAGERWLEGVDLGFELKKRKL